MNKYLISLNPHYNFVTYNSIKPTVPRGCILSQGFTTVKRYNSDPSSVFFKPTVYPNRTAGEKICCATHCFHSHVAKSIYPSPREQCAYGSKLTLLWNGCCSAVRWRLSPRVQNNSASSHQGDRKSSPRHLSFSHCQSSSLEPKYYQELNAHKLGWVIDIGEWIIQIIQQSIEKRNPFAEVT